MRGARSFAVKSESLMPVSNNSAQVKKALSALIGLRVFKAWNVYATRFFYFAQPDFQNYAEDGDFWLELECPWRIEHSGEVIVGSDDYGERADNNIDPSWDPKEMQSGHRQDQKLRELMGQESNGALLNKTTTMIVERVEADDVGGFQLSLSEGHILSVFPATAIGMQWLLSRRAGGNLSLMDSRLSGSLLA
jgi:hypothetical protein